MLLSTIKSQSPAILETFGIFSIHCLKVVRFSHSAPRVNTIAAPTHNRSRFSLVCFCPIHLGSDNTIEKVTNTTDKILRNGMIWRWRSYNARISSSFPKSTTGAYIQCCVGVVYIREQGFIITPSSLSTTSCARPFWPTPAACSGRRRRYLAPENPPPSAIATPPSPNCCPWRRDCGENR